MRTRESPGVKVLHYWNDYAHQTPTQKENNPLFDTEVEISDISGERRIACRFKRKLKVHNDQFSVDLNNDWFQLYAWGKVSSSKASVFSVSTLFFTVLYSLIMII